MKKRLSAVVLVILGVALAAGCGEYFGALWMLFLCFLTLRARERYRKTYMARWFRPGRCVWKDKEEHEWREIRDIMRCDPLTPNKSFRGREWESVFGDVILLLAGATILVSTAGIFWGGPLPPVFAPLVNDKLLAPIAAVLALAGVLYTIRAKVRSENRQKWIDEVPKNLAVVINYAAFQNAYNPADHQRFDTNTPPHLYPEANLARLTLELMINPSEKDHRAISTLLRLLCRIPLIQIDNEITKKLPCLAGTPQDQKELITWTIRLSNAMLKREWELIQYGK